MHDLPKKMSDFQRQHPAAALANAFDIIRGNLITIILLIFLGGGGSEASFTLYWILGTFTGTADCGGADLGGGGPVPALRMERLQIGQRVVVRKKLYSPSVPYSGY
ncbi:MAG: hypothetical protein U5J63_08960 [Fodinibius sp.]|nr:hypothetical protein [Fodinibius sp.]